MTRMLQAGLLIAVAVFSAVGLLVLMKDPAGAILSDSANLVAAQTIAAMATALGVLIAISAAVYTKMQIDISREAAAKSIYREYLRMAFENSQYSSWESYSSSTPKNAIEAREHDLKYRWFVAHMLFALEEILMKVSNGGIWLRVAVGQISYHIEYFDSEVMQSRLERFYAPCIQRAVALARAQTIGQSHAAS